MAATPPYAQGTTANLVDSSLNQLGTLSNPLITNPSGQTAQPVDIAAAATGGSTPYSYIAAASSNQDSQVIKNTAGTLYTLSLQCTQASIRYAKIYDKATAPTSSDTPKLRLLIPGNSAGAGNNVPIPACGIAFANGIAFRLTQNIADNDATACSANDAVLNASYA